MRREQGQDSFRRFVLSLFTGIRLRHYATPIVQLALILCASDVRGQSVEGTWGQFVQSTQISGSPYVVYGLADQSVQTARGFILSDKNAIRNPKRSAIEFLKQQNKWLGFDYESLDLRVVRVSSNQKNKYVRFKQYKNDKLVEGAHFQVAISPEGIFAATGQLANHRYNLVPHALVTSEVEAIARQHVTEEYTEVLTFESKYMIDSNHLLLNAIIDIGYANKVIRIDGTNGSVIESFPTSTGISDGMYQVSSSSSAAGYSESKTTCSSEADGTVYTGDPASDPETPFSSVGSPVTLKRLCGTDELDGRYVEVLHHGNSVPDDTGDFDYDPDLTEAYTYCSLESGAGSGFNMNDHDCSYFDSVNAYYHIDKLANYMSSTIGVDDLDSDSYYRIQANTHVGDGWAASFKRLSKKISLGHGDEKHSGSRTRDSAKFRDLIYHEYGHVIEWAQGSDLSSTWGFRLGEGYADYIAASFTGDSEIAEGHVDCPGNQLSWDTSVGSGAEESHLRDIDQTAASWNTVNIGTLEYNECNYQHDPNQIGAITTNSFWGAATGSVYEYGMVWAAALWDLRTKGTTTDSDKLIIDSIETGGGSPTSLDDAAQWILNQKHDTPSTYSSITYSEILNVFYQRGIYPTIIEEDWTIPSGTVITLDERTLTMDSGVRIIVEGTMELDNSTLQGIGSGHWDGLYVTGTLDVVDSVVEEVSSGTTSAAVVCVACELYIDGSTVEVDEAATDYALLFTTDVSNCATIKSSTLRSTNSNAIVAASSSTCANIINTKMFSKNDSYAVYAYSSADLEFSLSAIQDEGGNELTGKGLEATSGATIDAGSTPTVGGDNNFCRSSGNVTIRATHGSQIYADHNYFPSGNDPSIVELSFGSVTYSGNEGSSSCAVSKSSQVVQQVEDVDVTPYLPGMLRESVKMGDVHQFIYLIEQDLAVASVYPQVMAELRFAYKNSRSADLRASLIKESVRYSTPEYPHELLLAQIAHIDGKYDLAKYAYSQIASSEHTTVIANQARAELVGIYVREGNYDAASAVLELFVTEEEQGAAAYSLLAAILDMGNRSESSIPRSSEKGGLSHILAVDSIKNDKQTFSVDAYPNPFNPMTKLVLNLEDDSAVTMEVFDMLGRSIDVLEDGYIKAGIHHYYFGSEIQASGMYILRTEVEGYIHSTSLLLMK